MSYCKDAANKENKKIRPLIDKFNSENKYGYYLEVNYNKKREAEIKLYKSKTND